MKWTISADTVRSKFIEEVEGISGQKLPNCYQCGKCTAGCPIAFEMDSTPDRIIRMLQLGMREPVLSSRTIWLCASCETCTTRCPQEFDLAKAMDAIRQIAIREKYPPAERDVYLFNRVFLRNIRAYGRQFETRLVGEFNMISGHFFKDLFKAPKMFFQGKLKLLPSKNRNVREVRELFKRIKEMEKSISG